jgi:hypothetical protein
VKIKNDYPGLDALRISTREGTKPLMGFGVVAHLWFRRGGTVEKRHQILGIAANYASLFPGRLTRYQKSMANRLSRLADGNVVGAYQSEIDKTDPELNAHMINLLTDDHLEGVGFMSLSADNRTAPRYPLSYLSARFPGARVHADPDGIVRQVLAWCDQVKPDQGTVGIAPLFEGGMASAYPRVYWPYIARFVGMDYNWSFGIAVGAARGIKCVNWLTVLDDKYVAELGGLDALGASLGDGIVIHEWSGGILIQAGAEPQLGDTNMGIWPREYCAVSRATAKIRFEDYPASAVCLIKVPEPLDAHDETLRWVRRFDRDPTGDAQ